MLEQAECRRSDCTQSGETPFDIYCRATAASHFMPLGGTTASNAFVASIACVTLAALVFWSTNAPTLAPLYVGAALIGAPVLCLPLRLFPTSRVIALCGWGGLFAIAAAWRDGVFDSRAELLIVSGTVAALLLALVATVGVENEATDHREHSSPRLLATLWVLALGLIILRLLLGARAGTISDAHQQWITRSAEVCAALMPVVISVGAFLHGARTADVRVVYKPPRRHTAARFRRPLNPVLPVGMERSSLLRLTHVVTVIGVRVAALLVAGTEQVLAGFFWLWHLVVIAAALTAHRLRVWTTWLWAACAAATARAAQIVADGFGVFVAGAQHWFTSVVLATLLFASAAAASVMGCVWFQSYLLGGAFWQGPVAFALAGVAVAVLTLSWWALTKQPWARVSDGAQHNSTQASPGLLIGLLAIAWLDGIAGLAGLGPIRPGAMTIGGTVVMVAVTAVVLTRARAGAS